MWNWISSLDPNAVLAIATTVGAWIWNKANGKKTESITSIVNSIIDNFGHEFMDSYVTKNENLTEYLKLAREYINDRIWIVLTKKGIPKNSTTIKLVDAASERTTVWMAEEIRDIRRRSGHGPVL